MTRDQLLEVLRKFRGKSKRSKENSYLEMTCPFEKYKAFKVNCEEYCGKAFGGRYLEYGIKENACPCSYFANPLNALDELLED